MLPPLTRRTLGIAALAALPAGAAAGPSADRIGASLPDLVSLLQDGMARWQVPGAAVAVVAGQEVVLARGLGLREAGGSEPVGVDTVFQIGSATKAFTATTLAMLVDQGRLGWMDRVIDHDPGFALADPWVTREFRIVDLMAQRSGLRPYVLDTLWMLGYPPEALVAGLRHVRPIGSFRAEFAYQNVLHQVAGGIVARLAGVARWQDAVAGMILAPLGMTATTTTAEALLAAPDHATGHALYDGRLTALAPLPRFPYAPGPAGCLNASLTDMTTWLRFLIGRGETAGRRLLDAAALETTWKPRIDLREADGFPWTWQAYATGWVVRQTEGGVAIWHNGGTPQFRTHIGFIPARGVGIVVLTNEGSNELADAAGLWFYDRVLGNAPVDYAAVALERAREQARTSLAADRPPATAAPPGPGSDYAGRYRSEAAGNARVARAAGGGLEIVFETPGSRFGLAPRDGDVFALTSADPALSALLGASSPMLVQFLRTAHGGVDRIGLDGEPDVVFTRAAPG